ncbi:MAG: hypothetical protein Q9188_000278 [Gyalolechia gomerana]
MATLGNLVRLAPLDLDTLPPHPALELSVTRKRPRRASPEEAIAPETPQKATQAVNESEPSTIDVNGRPNLGPFIKAVLDEAVTFIDSTLPATFKPSSEKSSAPAAAKVQTLKREITGSELSNIAWLDSKIPRDTPDRIDNMEEAWFARKSRHPNRQDKGTARFSEFDYSLRVSHSEHEGEYTPDIFDTYKVLDWAVQDDSTEEESNFADYKQITMSTKTGTQDFIVVQIPVDIKTLHEAFYSNGRNMKEGDSALKRKKPILGYAISKASCLKQRCMFTANNEIEWTMATASDAKGWLPLWAQKMGIPGAIVKDVGLVVKWIHEHRAKSGS